MATPNSGAAPATAGTDGSRQSERPGPGQVTGLLVACRQGDGDAYRQLMSVVYEDLRRIARRQLRRRQHGLTLNTTGLVHEAYLKLLGSSRIRCRSRSHFLALSAHAMRQILVDYARSHNAQKRRANGPLVTLDEGRLTADRQARWFVALDEALAGLGSLDRRLVQVVECRFFAGYTDEETAEALGVSTRTVQRDWKRARAWLKEELGASERARPGRGRA